jgi:hypothetical protein
MQKILFLLAVTSLMLAACSNNSTHDIETPAVLIDPAQPTLDVRPTDIEISNHKEQCITERPMVLWETKGPAFEKAVKCIEELADRWWEEEEPALTWEGDNDGELFIIPDGKVGIGCCEGLFMPLQFMPYQEEIWADIQARFASFQYEDQDEKLIFKGKGEIASPAWQRAIATWSRRTWGQLYVGGVCAACSTVLVWRYEEWQVPEETENYPSLLVTDIGRVSVSFPPCDGNEVQHMDAWLTTDEWERFDAWLYGRASTHFADGEFWGRGSQQMDGNELAELSTWVESVYTRLTDGKSN